MPRVKGIGTLRKRRGKPPKYKTKPDVKGKKSIDSMMQTLLSLIFEYMYYHKKYWTCGKKTFLQGLQPGLSQT